METQTIIITIGRNVNGKPMADGDWEAFIASVSWLFFLDHHILVHTKARGTGYWEGDMEDNFTMVVTVPTGYIERLRQRVAEYGRDHGQEAIYFGLIQPGGVVPCQP
jgi:hypothetical protein